MAEAKPITEIKRIRLPDGQIASVKVDSSWSDEQILEKLVNAGYIKDSKVVKDFTTHKNLLGMGEVALNFVTSVGAGLFSSLAAFGDAADTFASSPSKFFGVGKSDTKLSDASLEAKMQDEEFDPSLTGDSPYVEMAHNWLHGFEDTMRGLADKNILYQPQTKEGQFFQKRLDEIVDNFQFGDEAGGYMLDKGADPYSASATYFVGENWLLLAPFVRKGYSFAKEKTAQVEQAAATLKEKKRILKEKKAKLDADAREANQRAPKEAIEDRIVDAETAVNQDKLSTEFSDILTAGAEAGVRGKGQLQDRIFKDVADLVETGYYDDIAAIRYVKEKHNLSNVQLAQLLQQSATYGGRVLNQFSQLKKKVKDLEKDFAGDPEALKFLQQWAKDSYTPTNAVDSFLKGWRKLENTRKVALTSQLLTTARNVETTTAYGLIDAVDRATQAAIMGGTKAFKERSLKPIGQEIQGWNQWFGAINRLNPKKRERLYDILKESSGIYDALLYRDRVLKTSGLAKSAEIYGDIYAPRLWNIVHKHNALQERIFQRFFMEAALRERLAREGMDFDTVDPKKIPDSMLQESLQEALEKTFSRNPTSKELKNILRTWSEIPPLSMIQPFPRFHFANNLKFVGDFGPWSFLRLMSSATRKRLRENPREAAKMVSRSAIGTYLLANSMEHVMNADEDQRWYEMKYRASDVPDWMKDKFPGAFKSGAMGDTIYFDTRPFSPMLSPYMLIANALLKPEELEAKDWAEFAVSVNRVSGTTLSIVDLMRTRDKERATDIIWRVGGQYVGSFFTPLRSARDLNAGWNPDEAIVRDMASDPILGPILNNVPWLNQKLPPKYSPLYPGIRRQEHPWLRQTFGLNARVKSDLEKEAVALDIPPESIYIRTGNKKADNIIHKYTGAVMNVYGKALLNNPKYRALEPGFRKQMFKDVMSQGKKYGYAVFLTRHPKLGAEVLASKQVDPDIVQGLQERFGIDVEKLIEGNIEQALTGMQQEVQQ